MNNEIDLICHCIEHMAKKNYAQGILKTIDVKFKPNDTLKNMSDEVRKSYKKNDKICLDVIRNLYRKIWEEENREDSILYHINNLQSNKLEGHDWHKTSPSMLHRGMQDRVRECSTGKIDIDELINIGADIMRQEYFIVATHDILESSIIKRRDDVIPPIGGSKSITDFIIKDYPMDLKVTHYPEKWLSKAGNMTKNDKIAFAKDLYDGADSERTRKQADKAKHNWGLNRLYVLVNNTDEWLQDPSKIINKVIEELEEPQILEVNLSNDIKTSVIVVEA